MNNDRSLLKHAIKIAIDGINTGGGPFGAVITRDGKVIAEADNRVVLSHDPSERKITFTHLPDAGGREAFGKWDHYEKKIPY